MKLLLFFSCIILCFFSSAMEHNIIDIENKSSIDLILEYQRLVAGPRSLRERELGKRNNLVQNYKQLVKNHSQYQIDTTVDQRDGKVLTLSRLDNTQHVWLNPKAYNVFIIEGKDDKIIFTTSSSVTGRYVTSEL